MRSHNGCRGCCLIVRRCRRRGWDIRLTAVATGCSRNRDLLVNGAEGGVRYPTSLIGITCTRLRTGHRKPCRWVVTDRSPIGGHRYGLPDRAIGCLWDITKNGLFAITGSTCRCWCWSGGGRGVSDCRFASSEKIQKTGVCFRWHRNTSDDPRKDDPLVDGCPIHSRAPRHFLLLFIDTGRNSQRRWIVANL